MPRTVTIEIEQVRRDGTRDPHGAPAEVVERRRPVCARSVQPGTPDDQNGPPGWIAGEFREIYVAGPVEVGPLDRVYLPGDAEAWQMMGGPQVWQNSAGKVDHTRFRVGRRRPVIA